MAETLKVVSPVDGSIYAERTLATDGEINAALAAAAQAQKAWAHVPVDERAAVCTRFVDALLARRDTLATELTWQMGRPIAHGPGEFNGFEERARHMIAIAPAALAPLDAGPKENFQRYIERAPLGVVLTVAAWNYPYLIAVNSVVPALMAGNAVVLKHSAQTPLCAEAFGRAFDEAGLPDSLFQVLHMSHAGCNRAIASPHTAYVAFTGSVAGGRAISQAAAGRFIGVGLELGGKDPAYVRSDCKLEDTVANLVDGAMFNAGQSCCGIERIYVDADIYDRFVEAYVAEVETYRLGDPRQPDTNLGPMVRTSAAEFVRDQVGAAIAAGAQALVDTRHFPEAEAGTPYLAPQVLTGVDHSMAIMTEETFGPVVGIMPVRDEGEAVALMNDSAYGLTASIWTEDEDAARRIGARVETGTWFMNRCDYLDPALAWTGVKDSGRGCTLSAIGYEHLTRPKSFHLRKHL